MAETSSLRSLGDALQAQRARKPCCVLAEACQQAVAPAQLLSALLDLDHRAVQPHLQRLWQLLWTAASQDGRLSPGGCSCCPCVHYAVGLACTAIEQYSPASSQAISSIALQSSSSMHLLHIHLPQGLSGPFMTALGPPEAIPCWLSFCSTALRPA